MRLIVLFTLVFMGFSTMDAMERPNFHTKGVPTGKPTGPLKPGEYWWRPELSPRGPVIALVSIPLQTLSVYRNGILIGRSSVSTGTQRHGTPAGVFTILEKKKSHRSKTYDNAPMPNMQRLTWSGIAMHSGNLPGYPASHGCIRMPYDFSQLLFNLTNEGGTVVIGDGKTPQPHLAANPGFLLAPKDLSPDMLRPLGNYEYQWRPERSPSGPITVLVSGAERALYVYRNGTPIGRAALEIRGTGPLGGHVFTMLDGVTEKPSWWAPNRPAREWSRVESDKIGKKVKIKELRKRIQMNPLFAAKLYDTIRPGTTLIVTDQPVVRKANRGLTIMSN